MDSSLLPAELTVRHFVHHKITLDLGLLVSDLGKEIRNTIIAVAIIKLSFDLVQAVLSMRTATRTR